MSLAERLASRGLRWPGGLPLLQGCGLESGGQEGVEGPCFYLRDLFLQRLCRGSVGGVRSAGILGRDRGSSAEAVRRGWGSLGRRRAAFVAPSTPTPTRGVAVAMPHLLPAHSPARGPAHGGHWTDSQMILQRPQVYKLVVILTAVCTDACSRWTKPFDSQCPPTLEPSHQP